MALRIEFVRQEEPGDCGLCCLSMVVQALGERIPRDVIRDRLTFTQTGTSALRVIEVARELNFMAAGIRVSPEHLDALPLPCIVHVLTSHFVVLEAIEPHHVRIVDPAWGRRRVATSRFREMFAGVAITVASRRERAGPPSREPDTECERSGAH